MPKVLVSDPISEAGIAKLRAIPGVEVDVKLGLKPEELKAIIAAHQSELARNLTEKLLAYALCRQLEGYDEIVVDHLMATIAKDGYRMQTLVTEIVTSYPFMHLRTQDQLTSSAHDKEPAN